MTGDENPELFAQGGGQALFGVNKGKRRAKGGLHNVEEKERFLRPSRGPLKALDEEGLCPMISKIENGRPSRATYAAQSSMYRSCFDPNFALKIPFPHKVIHWSRNFLSSFRAGVTARAADVGDWVQCLKMTNDVCGAFA